MTPHSQAKNAQHKNAACMYINDPSLSLSSLDTWIKATEEGLTRTEAVRSAETTGTAGGILLPPHTADHRPAIKRLCQAVHLLDDMHMFEVIPSSNSPPFCPPYIKLHFTHTQPVGQGHSCLRGPKCSCSVLREGS